MTLRQTAWFWVGTNANLFFVSVGVIALEVGLEVWQALVAVVLGTSLFVAVGVASIGGARSGLPTMTFTRAAFGSRGNIPNGVLTWAALVAFEAINCIFGVFALLALMAELGWEDPGAAGKVLATLLVLGASARSRSTGTRRSSTSSASSRWRSRSCSRSCSPTRSAASTGRRRARGPAHGRRSR